MSDLLKGLYTALVLFLFRLKRKKVLKFILIQLFILLFFLITKVYFSKNYDKKSLKRQIRLFQHLFMINVLLSYNLRVET